MDRNSRAFKMLQVLNNQQREKIQSFRHVVKRPKLQHDNDPDFIVSESETEHFDDTSSGNSVNEENQEPELNKKSLNRVQILSDITLRSENLVSAEYSVPQDEEEGREDCVPFIKEILQDIIHVSVDRAEKNNLTKKGEIRKRKKFKDSLAIRKKRKLTAMIAKHGVKPPCNSCKRKCSEKITEKRRTEINEEFWKLQKNEQKNFIFNNASEKPTKRKTTASVDSRRSKSFFYFLKDNDGCKQSVCKIFFMRTLGYENKNDRVIRDALTKTNSKVTVKRNQQGKTGKNKIDRNIIIQHIESFKPTVPHYRREHAPERRYLPSDINIKMMYKDFIEKYTKVKFSYYLYREVVSNLKISFVKLGHEECWVCESFDLHSKATFHKKDALVDNCEECTNFEVHQTKYRAARSEYQSDSSDKSNTDDTSMVVSTELQKVIMLPRMDMFKEIIFTPRIIAFNESFVVTAKKPIVPTAILWHEGLAGRSKKDITSTFYKFFLSNRDAKNVIIWLYNCSAQNKNWTLFTFFAFIVNSDEIALETLIVKYFEPGHTFMAADSFHHQVERSMKQMGKVYDFKDFTDAVANAASNAKIINMELADFFDWQDGTSQYKLNKINPRPYLNQMVQVHFCRGKYTFTYKTSFKSETESEVNFLNAKIAKQGMAKPSPKSIPRGITAERKQVIISKLCGHMPKSRQTFWNDLPTSMEPAGLDD